MSDTELIDPLKELQEIAERQQSTEDARKSVGMRRAELIYGGSLGTNKHQSNLAFLATLAMRLEPSPCFDIDTTSTDGEHFFYNPQYVCKLKPEELRAVLAQNVLHCALHHITRQGPRDSKKWDIACDLAVNPILAESGMSIPTDQPFPGKGSYKDFPLNDTAEGYYELLRDSDNGDQSGEGDAQGASQTMPSPDSAAASATESQWAENVSAAHAEAEKKAGELSSGLRRLCTETLRPKASWQDILRQFVNSFTKNDYTYSPCNRRFVHMGLYLPSLRSEELGDIVVAVDCSGSVDQGTLTQFAGELQGILEAFDVHLTIVYHDSKVCHVDEWSSEDGPLTLEAHGGFGTNHAPVFEWVDEHKPDAIAVICLTDLYTNFPSVVPAQPVIWGVINHDQPTAPFGEIVNIN